MNTHIDFYFDFLSPYAYLAATRIESLAQKHGREVHWHSFRLGVAVVKFMGLKPLMETPLKNDYIRADLKRLAKIMDLPLIEIEKLPDPIPPALAFYAAPKRLRGKIAQTLLTAQWAKGQDVGKVETLKCLLEPLSVSPDIVQSAQDDPAIRALLRHATAQTIERGVFGSPTVVADDELFWGTDRLWLLDRYLGAGGSYEPAREQQF